MVKKSKHTPSSEDAPKEMKRKEYERELTRLEIELVKRRAGL
jgi:hypothetical protein